jgi:hypothetical protein
MRIDEEMVPVEIKVGKSVVGGAGDPEQGTPLLMIESRRLAVPIPTDAAGTLIWKPIPVTVTPI